MGDGNVSLGDPAGTLPFYVLCLFAILVACLLKLRKKLVSQVAMCYQALGFLVHPKWLVALEASI